MISVMIVATAESIRYVRFSSSLKGCGDRRGRRVGRDVADRLGGVLVEPT
jgi:hypothetical protein